MQKTVQKSWAKETLKAILVGIEQNVEVEESKEFFEVLHIPYVNGFSKGFQKKLKNSTLELSPRKEKHYIHMSAS